MDMRNDDGKAPGDGPIVATCGNGSDAELAGESIAATTAAQPPRDVLTPSASLLNVKCEVKSCSLLVLRHPNKSETQRKSKKSSCVCFVNVALSHQPTSSAHQHSCSLFRSYHLCAAHANSRNAMIDQASKSKNSVDLVKELRRMERENLEEFLEHLQNFSDTWLDAMAWWVFIE